MVATMGDLVEVVHLVEVDLVQAEAPVMEEEPPEEENLTPPATRLTEVEEVTEEAAKAEEAVEEEDLLALEALSREPAILAKPLTFLVRTSDLNQRNQPPPRVAAPTTKPRP